jgi:hypothetical protein
MPGASYASQRLPVTDVSTIAQMIGREKQNALSDRPTVNASMQNALLYIAIIERS